MLRRRSIVDESLGIETEGKVEKDCKRQASFCPLQIPSPLAESITTTLAG
jgi:hypothetical protein